MALGRVLLHVAVASEDLDAFDRRPHRHVGGVILGHRRLLFEVEAVVLQPGGPQQHQLRRIEFGGHVGQLELDRLEGGDRLPELHPLLGVFDGVLEGRPADPAGLGADADPSRIEAREHLLESLAGLSEQIFRRHLGVLKDQLRRPGGEKTHFLLHLPDPETRGVLQVDDQVDDGPVTAGRIGCGGQHAVARDVAAGDEALDPVDDVPVALELRAAFQGGRIGAGGGFRQRVAAVHLAARDRGEELLLLRLRAEGLHRVAVQAVVDRGDDAAACAGLGDLDQGHNVGHVVHPGSVVLRRHGNAHEPHLAQLPADLLGVAVGAVQFRGNRLDLRLCKFPDHLPDHLLFVRGCKIHREPPSRGGK